MACRPFPSLGHCHGYATHVASADDDIHLILRYQAFGSVDCLSCLTFRIVESPCDLLAIDSTGSVDIVDCHFHAGFHVVAQKSGGAGYRQDGPYMVGIGMEIGKPACWERVGKYG